MTFSQSAGYSIVPVFARLVLCAAFFFHGWNKCIEDATFNAEQATRLQQLGVNVTAVGGDNTPAVTGASWRQDPETGTIAGRRATPPPDTDTGGEATPPPTGEGEQQATPPAESEPQTGDGEPESGADGAVLAPGEYTARMMHHVTLAVDGAGWPNPSWMPTRLLGILAGVTELVGAAMLLVGLFSRLWAMGLAFTMGVAFYLTSWDAVRGTSPWDLAMDQSSMAFGIASLQLALFVLAIGIVLTGAGGLSLDRLLFRRGGGSEDISDSD